jgi:hypothetical protein
MDAGLISLVSACTALVASIAGPFVTLFVAKRQFNANVLSANRQRWIEALRDQIAEVLSLMVAAAVIRNQSPESWDRGRGAIARDPKLIAKLERIVLVACKIRLLTNPTEPDHVELNETLEAAFKRLQSSVAEDDEMDRDILKITQLAQRILKREWQRVKAGS